LTLHQLISETYALSYRTRRSPRSRQAVNATVQLGDMFLATPELKEFEINPSPSGRAVLF
jgi:hypothetical protein